jgi:murein DD-endopeptidase MepM/ murein hydrolase activator NlpD
MKKVRLWQCLFLLGMAVLQVLLTEEISESAHRRNCFSYEKAFDNLRNHNLTKDQSDTFFDAAESDIDKFSELLTMYFASDCQITDPRILKEQLSDAKKYRGDEFSEIKEYVKCAWSDLLCFPVGKIVGKPDDTVGFENSWMQSRTFGGDRGHEGCDIIASENVRGIYPVYSMTDGVVENIGWLRLGGYRIGIRSPSGAYFYYAHLAEYAKDFQIGEQISAGTFLGFMGDTGYSDVEGTTGNFVVHLHMGIYLNDKNGTEFSVNSYPMLSYLWERQGGVLR